MNLRILFPFVVSLFPLLLNAQVYVNQSATGSNNGSSWSNAYTDLQDALANAPLGSEIWVAKGTYFPSSTGVTTVSFSIPHSLSLYGGFSGNEADLKDRNLGDQTTILSGDYNGDDQVAVTLNPLSLTFSNYGENAQRIVEAKSISGNIIIDGFTITGGNNPLTGGGMFFDPNNDGLTVTLRNCDLRGNRTDGTAGAIRLSTTAAQEVLTFRMENCKGWNNQCINFAARGGFLLAVGSGVINMDFFNCEFYQNFALVRGGVIETGATVHAKYINCLFRDNRSASGGVSFENTRGSTFYNNCIFYNNGASLEGFAIYNFDDFADVPVHLYNCIFLQNGIQPLLGRPDNGFVVSNNVLEYTDFGDLLSDAPGSMNSGGNLFNVDPLFVDANAKDFNLQSTSPCINTGENSVVVDGTDFTGKIDRIVDGTVDMGIYEYHRPLSVETNEHFCFEETLGSANLVADNYPPFQYEWSDSNIQGADPDNLMEGSYSVTITNDIGDQVVTSFSLTKNTEITADIDLTLPTNGADGSLTVNVMGGTPPYTYVWNTTPVQTGATATNLDKGYYAVTVTDAANCAIKRSIVLAPVGLQSIDENPEIEVTPSLFSEEVYLTLSGSLLQATDSRDVAVYNSVGQLVYHQTLATGGSMLLPLATLPRGLYVLELTIGDQHFGKRLVKQ